MMDNLKEYKLPLESFIQGWYIDESICDDIINLFNDRKEYWVEGIVADRVQPDRKQSTDLYVNKNDTTKPIFSYRTQLQWCLEQYVKTYPELMLGGFFNINLVFMTYLNDVEDGGTQFKYQNLITPAKKGLTLIWPTDFTHTHRGVISQTKEKYIVTGWYSYTV